MPGSEGWARRRQEHVKAVLGEETPDQVRGRLYRTLEALIRWCWGAPVEEARAGLPLGRSGFYWRLEQVLTRLPQLLEDGRCHNGRRWPQAEAPTQTEAEMEEEIAGRIVEIVVGQPGDSSLRERSPKGTRWPLIFVNRNSIWGCKPPENGGSLQIDKLEPLENEGPADSPGWSQTSNAPQTTIIGIRLFTLTISGVLR